MKIPSVSRYRLCELLYYDSETGVFYWKVDRGNKIRAGAVAGSVKSNGYRLICIDKKWYSAHRLAWFYFYGQWPDRMLDHKDRNPDHNAIDNLREATNGQNQANRHSRVKNATGFKGVTHSRNRKRFRAAIEVNGKQINIGSFGTAVEASIAYKKAAREYFGEFAVRPRLRI